jgi:hypothetical protein
VFASASFQDIGPRYSTLRCGEPAVIPQTHPDVEDVERQIRFIANNVEEFPLQNADFFRAVHSVDFEMEGIRR